MKQKSVTILIVVFAVVMVGAFMLYHYLGDDMLPDQLATQPLAEQQTNPQSSTEATEEARKPAPDFTVYDIDGKEVHLSDYLGKPVVLNFWASWCGPCKKEMPDFEEKFQELGENVQFLMVNATDGSRETVETASAFIAEKEYTFPVFYDTGYSASLAYGANSLPTTFFIDAEGNLAAYAKGTISTKILVKGIDMIYKG